MIDEPEQPDIIADLISAADEIEQLPKQESAALLERAAVQIETIRERAGYRPTSGETDAVQELRDMARLIIFFKPEQVAAAMRNTAQVLCVGEIMLARRMLH